MNDTGYRNRATAEDFFHVLDAAPAGASGADPESPAHLRELAHLVRLSNLGEMTSELTHELTQPFAAIVNYSRACELLLDAGEVRDARDMAARLGAQAKLALGIIGALRQFARKESVEQQPVDLRSLARSTLDLARWDATARGVPLALEAPESVPAIYGDPMLLGQVVLNLVRNAMDATGDGGSPVVVVLQHIGASVELCVRDRGPGLTPEVKAHLFEPFFTTKPDGVGIGLALSRRIIERHGGRLWAENNPAGAGACFGFTLPIRPDAR